MPGFHSAGDYLWVAVLLNILAGTRNAHVERTPSTNDRSSVLPEVTILQRTLQVFSDEEEVLADLLDNFDTLLPDMLTLSYQSDSGAAWVQAIKSFYFNNDLTTNTSEILTNLTLLMSDALFFYPAHNALQQQLALMTNPQYFCTFNYEGSLSYAFEITGATIDHGIGHTDDLIYIFPSNATFSSFGVAMSESDFEMVDTMVELWTSFAINGTPTTTANNNSVTWGAFSTKDNYLRIGNDSDVRLEVQYSFFEERMRFWDALRSTTSTSGTITNYSNLIFALLLLSLNFILSELPLA